MRTRLKPLLVGCLLLLQVQGSAADRFPIAREQVLALLHLKGAGPALLMPNAFSRVSAPKLRVIRRDQEASTLRLRIGCRGAAECLPFVAVLQFPSADEARRCAEDIAYTAGTPIHRNSDLVLVRPGELAHLEVPLSRKITVRINVRCLQAGKIDDIIRVRDEESRKTYRALVLGKGELRASL